MTRTGTDDAAEPATPAQHNGETPQACEEHREKLLDEALDESFPASDPPSAKSRIRIIKSMPPKASPCSR